MRCIARKVKYAASGGHVYVALVELREKEDQEPCCYVLYRYIVKDYKKGSGSYEMLVFASNEDTEKVFPYGRGGFWERENNDWKKTTDWLHGVAVGGSYQEHEKGTDVVVEAPDSIQEQWHTIEELTASHRSALGPGGCVRKPGHPGRMPTYREPQNTTLCISCNETLVENEGEMCTLCSRKFDAETEGFQNP